MKVLRTTAKGEDVLGCELEVEIKSLEDSQGKALGDYEVEVIGSTTSIDSYGESIDQNGWDLKRYKKNPVILAQHNYQSPPIARATSVKVVDGKLMFKVEFPEEGINPEADVYRKLVKSGFLNTTSVGFIGREFSTDPKADGEKKPYRTYTKAELLELSFVSIPANQDAVVTGRSFVEKGILTEEELEVLTKGEDPAVAYGVDTQSQINSLCERFDALDKMLEELDKRIIYIEGVLQLGKPIPQVEQDSIQNDISLIREMLCGTADQKQDAQATATEPTDDVSCFKTFLKQKLTGS